MRTTLDIDEDILHAAKTLAAEQRISAGKVISDLARKALVGEPLEVSTPSASGFCLLPNHGQVITPEFIRMLDEQSE